VKRRLNEAGDLDAEIQAHLRDCRDCRREFEASRILDSAFEASRREEDLPPTHFNDLRARLEQLSSRVKENSIMAKIKKEITGHPRFSFGIAISIFVFAFIILVPISYEKTVGYELALSGISSEDTTDKEVAADIVTALGYGEAAFSFEVDGNLVKYHIRGIPSKKAAKEISSALSSLIRSVPDIIITPIIVEATGSIYAQVKEKIDLKVETEGKTDEEVRKELEEGLKKRGYKDPRVTVTSDSEGQRRIVIKNVKLPEGEDKTFETMEIMELLVGEGGEIEIKSPVKEKLDIDTEGKTNEMIIKELKKKLVKRGIKNPKITIKDLPDGKREINVEVGEEKKID
jgi:hypothetical protein